MHLYPCFHGFLLHVAQAEPLSYVGPGEIIGIGVLVFVIILLLILFVAFRKKIKFRKESDPDPGTQTATGVSTVSTETSYMLHKTGMGAEGIEFKAVRVSGLPGTTGTYGEVGGGTGGPPQVVVRPTAHSPLPGGLSSQWSGDGDKTASGDSGQVSQTMQWHVSPFPDWETLSWQFLVLLKSQKTTFSYSTSLTETF